MEIQNGINDSMAKNDDVSQETKPNPDVKFDDNLDEGMANNQEKQESDMPNFDNIQDGSHFDNMAKDDDFKLDEVDNEDLEFFLSIYPEFKKVFTSQDDVKNFESVFNRVSCLYPEFKNKTQCQKVPFYALVAHYFVYQGFGSKVGILAQKGLVASSSVGDVSVSYQSSPYATKGNDSSYFLSLSPYGMEYLAWLQRQAGIVYVN